MTDPRSANYLTPFNPFLNVKKGLPFQRDKIKSPICMPQYCDKPIKSGLLNAQKIVPILGRTVRIHLNCSADNKIVAGHLTVTGIQGKVIPGMISPSLQDELFRLFPFAGYTKLEAFFASASQRIHVYDILRRDGQTLSSDILTRENLLPLTSPVAAICCLRSIQSLTQLYEQLDALELQADWKGFLIRSGDDYSVGSGMRLVLPTP